MKAVIYARISKSEEFQNPERQLMKCRQYCELNDHEILGEGCDSITGETDPFERGAFQNMLRLKPDLLVVVSMDRLTREDLPKVFKRLEQLNKAGIGFVSVTEPMFNADNEFRAIFISLIAWFNNYYLRELSRKVKQGQERARKEGRKIGRPKKIDRALEYQIIRRSNEGESLREIAKSMEVSKSLVHKVLVENRHLLYKKLPNSEDVHKTGV